MGLKRTDPQRLTLILLRPDGSNRTFQVRKSLFRLAAAAGVITGLLLVSLSVIVALQYRSLQRLTDQYRLLLSREVLALTPRPAPADDVPGAAERLEAPPGFEIDPASPLPAADQPAGRPPVVEASGEAPVRLDDFQVRPGTGSRGWRVSLQLTKREWDGDLLRGYSVIVIEDAGRPERYLTFPPLTLQQGYPVTSQAGEPFAIRRLKPIEAEFTLPEGFQFQQVRVLIFDREGALIIDRGFPVEGGP